MKVMKIIVKVSYGNISKIVSLNSEATYENLLTTVVKEFSIPDNAGSSSKFTDLDGAVYTKDSLEYIMNRSATENNIQHIVLTSDDTGLQSSNNDLSSDSTNQSENHPQCNIGLTALIGSKLKDVVSGFNELNLRLTKIEDKLDKSNIDSSNQKDEPEVELNEDSDTTCQPTIGLEEMNNILTKRESTVIQREAKLEEYDKYLRHREDELNQRETRLNETEIALDKLVDDQEAHYNKQIKQLKKQKIRLHKTRNNIHKQEKKFNRWERELNEREIKIRDQHLTLKKLEDVMDQLAAELNRKREQLNEQESFLKHEETKLMEEKSKVKYYRNLARSKGRQHKMALEEQFYNNETKFNEELSRLKDEELRLNVKELELHEKESDLYRREFLMGQQNSADGEEMFIFLP